VAPRSHAGWARTHGNAAARTTASTFERAARGATRARVGAPISRDPAQALGSGLTLGTHPEPVRHHLGRRAAVHVEDERLDEPDELLVIAGASIRRARRRAACGSPRRLASRKVWFARTGSRRAVTSRPAFGPSRSMMRSICHWRDLRHPCPLIGAALFGQPRRTLILGMIVVKLSVDRSAWTSSCAAIRREGGPADWDESLAASGAASPRRDGGCA